MVSCMQYCKWWGAVLLLLQEVGVITRSRKIFMTFPIERCQSLPKNRYRWPKAKMSIERSN